MIKKSIKKRWNLSEKEKNQNKDENNKEKIK